MLRSIYEQRRALGQYATDHDIVTLTSSQWDVIDRLLQLLQPFEELTKQASSESEYISVVIPSVILLQKVLNKNNDSNLAIMEIKKSLQQSITHYFFDKQQIMSNKNYLVATVIDPRFKTMLLSGADVERSMEFIITEMTALSDTSESNKAEDIAIIIDPNTKSNLSNDLWSVFDELAAENTVAQQQATLTESGNKQELDAFLAIPVIDRKKDPTVWWSQQNKFPTLYKVARQFLSAPPGSVFSERMFSEAGIIYESKRNRLLPEKAKELHFLHYNLPELNYDVDFV